MNKPRLLDPDAATAIVESVATDIKASVPEKEPEPPVSASEALRGFATEHIRPTIDALTTLEQTIAGAKATLQKELATLCAQSEGFAAHNVEAIRCLNICTDAVEQLINGRK